MKASLRPHPEPIPTPGATRLARVDGETNGELPGPAAWFALGESREHGRAPVPLAAAPRGLRRAPSDRLCPPLRARPPPRCEGTRHVGLPGEDVGSAAGVSAPRQEAGTWHQRR